MLLESYQSWSILHLLAQNDDEIALSYLLPDERCDLPANNLWLMLSYTHRSLHIAWT
jgi:hypothetical protein